MAYDNALGLLPDPTTNPTGPGFVSQSIIDNSPGMVHPLNHGGTISVKFSGSYWTIDIAYPELTIAEATPLMGFLYSLQGTFTNFYIQLPTHTEPSTGTWVGIFGGVLATGAKSNQIDIFDYNTRDIANNFTIGDMLKLTNSNKIYMITNTELVGSTMTLTFNSDVVNPATVVTASLEPNAIKFRVRQTNIPKFSLNTDGLYGSISLSLRENIYG